MSKQFRNFFFSGGTGVSFRLFRTGNIPNETNYRHLMDSVLFFNEVNDTAKEGEAGHVKKETDARAMARSLPHTDNFSRCVLAHQLPLLFAEQQAYQTAGTTLTGRGISITPLDSTIYSTHRLDFLVENTLEFISSDSSIHISETTSGIIDLQVGSGIELYMVKATSTDPTPGYLDSKVGNSMEIIANALEVKYNDTNSINFGITASGLEANLQIQDTNTIEHLIGAFGLSSDLRYDATYFDVNASGLVIRPLSIDYSLIVNNTITIGKLNSNIFGDGLTVGGTVDVDPKNSIELDGVTPNKQVQLVGDQLSPGNDMFYGTDGTGTKGFHDILPYAATWKYESYTFTPIADLASGTANGITSGGAVPQTIGIDDSGAAYTIDEFVGKVVVFTYLGKTFARIVDSNTATSIYFDSTILQMELLLGASVSYRILEPYTITSDNPQVLACYTTTNDGAVILPNVSVSNDRKPIKIYIEDGNYDIFIVGQSDLITSASYYKHYALEHKNELVGLLPHSATFDHFDVVEEVLIKEFLSAYWNKDYNLVSTTSAQKITENAAPTVIVDDRRRMTEFDDSGFYSFESNSLLPKEIHLTANIVITKSGASDGDVLLQFYKNGAPLNRSVTTRFGSGEGTTTLVLSDLTEINFTDVIDLYVTVSNTTPSYSIDTGSSIILKE